MQSVGNETGAHARLDDIIDSSTRDMVTNHRLLEALRNTNDLVKRQEEGEQAEAVLGTEEALERIEVGRERLTREILERARVLVPQYGIELVDVRIKRINYVEAVRIKVYERMISERRRAAEKYRSEGQGKRAEIGGEMQKELKRISSEAYRTAQEIKGKADARAIRIYADAYSKDPEFYSLQVSAGSPRHALARTSHKSTGVRAAADPSPTAAFGLGLRPPCDLSSTSRRRGTSPEDGAPGRGNVCVLARGRNQLVGLDRGFSFGSQVQAGRLCSLRDCTICRQALVRYPGWRRRRGSAGGIRRL